MNYPIMLKIIFILLGCLLLQRCSNKEVSDEKFTLTFRIKPNSLGYARVRSNSIFSCKDTSNVIGRIACGTKVHVAVPTEFLAGGKWKDKEPWYYLIKLNVSEGSELIGYIHETAMISYDQYEEDSACNSSRYEDYGNLIILKGIYKGKNLYVQNPFSDCHSNGFCTIKYTVNGNMTADAVESSGYEIDLSLFRLKLGENVEIRIEHKTTCLPKILNPEVILENDTTSSKTKIDS